MLTYGEYTPSPVEQISQHVAEYENSNGAEGYLFMGRPVVILTSKGAKTGKMRKVPVMRVEHDGQYAIVGSTGGADKHPGWYHNIRREPRVQLQDGPVKRDYIAREVFGEERSTWWARATATWPEYDGYTKLTTRTIPVFVLTEIES